MDYPVVEIKPDSKQYPKKLKHIHDAPKQLYCRGDVSLLQTDCFTVVGTRKITPYGKEAVQHIVPGLAKYFTIVSGLALGIDAVAHQATLQVHGKTIAVLATPVTDPTPRTNLGLAKEILASGGLLISEYKKGDHIGTSNFAIRDRILSGLSRGVLVVEADLKSGSLVTAKSALDQNRDVFAVPGSIFSLRTAGPHMLIQHGAKLVASTEDILQEYDQLPLPKSRRLSTANPTEIRIIDILTTSGPLSVDAIIEKTKKETSEILATLAVMELNGLITQSDNGIYRANE
ncbi:MAG: DNA protecting protein DprA [Candidatus Yanofskybacteria bacterium RIFCSPLOWO2_02_FULL_47_9b]|uniref:DNA protecting protein DprA n=1 Tax=Candidatus Yanofskybacteria bacterium RIFCSPLOWO2_02_FULL_47_9b TaxID=1802708 RepID=A0A1F8H5Q1_9BACT|nr:MAG: DNA protecting protein DprA [Candidatus Yanofskybacteria bacterium RIFCSPLOWO2_02_FULL_47_9b]